MEQGSDKGVFVLMELAVWQVAGGCALVLHCGSSPNLLLLGCPGGFIT